MTDPRERIEANQRPEPEGGWVAAEVGGRRLELAPQRAVYWPAQEMLLVADLHLGKEATFRRNGIAAPEGPTVATLRAVSWLLSRSGAARLCILGDLFHAPSSLAAGVRRHLDEFFARHPQVTATLILGNHDRALGNRLAAFPLRVVKHAWEVDRVMLTHEPQPPDSGADLTIAGHLHPALRVEAGPSGRCPCFWWSRPCFVLPAMGAFTGTSLVKAKRDDRLWLVAGDRVIPSAARFASR
jgi:DNA ligase-associated metallophosphoesterase